MINGPDENNNPGDDDPPLDADYFDE